MNSPRTPSSPNSGPLIDRVVPVDRSRMARGTKKPTLAWARRRNGVALTVLLGLVLIGLLALTQSGVAIFAVPRFGASFNQIAATNLPNLIAAPHPAELRQSLVDVAPETSHCEPTHLPHRTTD